MKQLRLHNQMDLRVYVKYKDTDTLNWSLMTQIGQFSH